MIRKVFTIVLLLALVFCTGYRKPFKYTILAEKDAFLHNNIGLNYLKDRVYYAAIQEFKIAISLSPNTQASAIFYNNLGETYNYIGYPDMAKDCFENAIRLYGLNFKYYLNLAECYINIGEAQNKIAEFQKSDNVYDRITLGILYVQTGEKRRGINLLDEIAAEEPDLIITSAIKKYIADTIKIMQRQKEERVELPDTIK